MLLTGGSEQSRDLPVPGRELEGVHFAWSSLPQQNKVNAGDKLKGQRIRPPMASMSSSSAAATPARLRGHLNRHGAASVTQFEVMPMPPEQENKPWSGPTGLSSCVPIPATTRAWSSG